MAMRITPKERHMIDCFYENMRRISYEGGAVFVPVCQTCGRFVRADKTVLVNDCTGLKNQPNASCSKCGRTKMVFEGFCE